MAKQRVSRLLRSWSDEDLDALRFSLRESSWVTAVYTPAARWSMYATVVAEQRRRYAEAQNITPLFPAD